MTARAGNPYLDFMLQNAVLFPWGSDDEREEDAALHRSRSPRKEFSGSRDRLVVEEDSANPISWQLPNPAAQAGRILEHCQAVIHRVRLETGGLELALYKIGITHECYARFDLYKAKGWDQMVIMHESPDLGSVEMLEAALISHHRGPRLQEFWERYRLSEPDHDIWLYSHFQEDTLVPLLVHGDGGRTDRKDELMVLQFQPMLGFGTRASHKMLRPTAAGVNLRKHTFTTRFLYGVMGKALYRENPACFTSFLTGFMENLAKLFFEGITLQGQHFRFVVLGVKGDLPFLQKAGNLLRTFLNVRKAPETPKSKPLTGCCFLCLAGTADYPFEEFTDSPKWLQTAGSRNPYPWDALPPLLESTPHIHSNPASLFRLDILHVYHLGVGRDFVASSLVVLLDLYEASSVPEGLDLMTADLRRFLSQNRRQLHFKIISRDLLGFKKESVFPVGHWSKASDTPILMEFLLWLLQQHRSKMEGNQLFRVIYGAADAMGVFMHTVLQAGLWLTTTEATSVCEAGMHFLKSYGKCSSLAYRRNLTRYNLTPKLHCWHHICLDLKRSLDRGLQFHLSPLADANFADEDFVGRVSRLSRRVSPRLQGRFAAGQPRGHCEYYDPDDRTTLVGSYVAGQLHGRAVQLDESGLLVFRGAFEKDVRAGMAQVFDDFGGCVVGAVDAEGEHSGDEILYVFPDGLTALVGSFNDGVFVRGRYARLQAPLVRPARESDLEDLLSADVDFPAFALVKEIRDFVHRDVSTRETLSAQPMIPDIFELERVTVSQSGLKEDMEGLFAKRPLRAGELCSWYNGLRCSHEEVNERDWCLNGMTIALDNDTVLDVPAEFASTDVFRACLGHKANHRKPNNAKYDVFDHPRFGLIKAIRAVRDIAAGEEICCDYGYEGEQEDLPGWYADSA
eukprot:s406_g1.t2